MGRFGIPSDRCSHHTKLFRHWRREEGTRRSATYVLLKLTRVITPLRISEDDEIEGLDFVLHNERGCDL